MDEKTNTQPFDFLFRYNTRNYPKISHTELKLPGKFDEIKDTAVCVIDNGVLQMDYVESIKPDGNIVKRDSLNDVEQQTGKLSFKKIEDIFNYCLYTTIQHKKPCYPIVVTNHDYKKSHEDYIIEGFSFRVYFKIFNRQKVYKLLNTLTQKDYNQSRLTNTDFIQFIHCIIFAKNHMPRT